MSARRYEVLRLRNNGRWEPSGPMNPRDADPLYVVPEPVADCFPGSTDRVGNQTAKRRNVNDYPTRNIVPALLFLALLLVAAAVWVGTR